MRMKSSFEIRKSPETQSPQRNTFTLLCSHKETPSLCCVAFVKVTVFKATYCEKLVKRTFNKVLKDT